jgi:TRAP-type C4-dicarboxylate transport system permease small subunit
MEIFNLLLALLILVGIIYGVYKTVAYTHRSLKSLLPKNLLRLLFRLALIIISCVVGSLLATLMWKLSETELMMGFPIPAAAWEYRAGRWLDFVSPVSPLLCGLDFIIGIWLVHLPVAAVVLLVKNGKAHRLRKTAA